MLWGARDKLGGSSVCPRGVWSLSWGLPKPPTGAKRPSCTPSSPLLTPVLRKSRGLAAGMGSVLTWMGYPFHTSRRS